MRLGETPWGIARFTFSYLAALLALIATAILSIIAWPVIGALPGCRVDPEGLCQPIYTTLVGVVAFAGFCFLAAFIMRLGWQWAGWMVVLPLIVLQIIIDNTQSLVAWAALAIPGLAALITFERPDKQRRLIWTIISIVALCVGLVQFIIWLIILATES